MQILACSRILYQARRKIPHWSTYQLSRIQAMRRKLTDTQALGDLDDLRMVAVIITTRLFLFQGTHMQYCIYNSSCFQKALLQRSDWTIGRTLSSWESLFVNWVIKNDKALFQFLWSNSIPQEFYVWYTRNPVLSVWRHLAFCPS